MSDEYTPDDDRITSNQESIIDMMRKAQVHAINAIDKGYPQVARDTLRLAGAFHPEYDFDGFPEIPAPPPQDAEQVACPDKSPGPCEQPQPPCAGEIDRIEQFIYTCLDAIEVKPTPTAFAKIQAYVAKLASIAEQQAAKIEQVERDASQMVEVFKVRVTQQAAKIKTQETALQQVVAHTGHLPNPPLKLVIDLLANIKRIATSALAEN